MCGEYCVQSKPPAVSEIFHSYSTDKPRNHEELKCTAPFRELVEKEERRVTINDATRGRTASNSHLSSLRVGLQPREYFVQGCTPGKTSYSCTLEVDVCSVPQSFRIAM